METVSLCQHCRESQCNGYRYCCPKWHSANVHKPRVNEQSLVQTWAYHEKFLGEFHKFITDFVTARPDMFVELASVVLIPPKETPRWLTTSDMSSSLGNAFGAMFEAGSAHVAAKRFTADELVKAVFKPLVCHPWICAGQSRFIDSVAVGLSKMDDLSQKAVFLELRKIADQYYQHFLDIRIFEAASMEGQDALCRVVVASDVNVLARKVTAPIMNSLSAANRHAVAFRLMTVLPQLSEEMTTIVHQSVVNDEDDSDEGF